jgi:hypothetical protein
MQQEQRAPNKYLRWVKFLDRVKAWFKDEPVHKDYTAAAYALADAKALQRKEVVKKQTETQYEGVHPEIVEFWKAMQKACKARNIPVLAFEMLRSEERQYELYVAGRSLAKGGDSPHQYGMAVDIVHAVKYWQISKKEWDIIGSIGKEVARKRNIKVEWGGDWEKLWDPAHWQLMGWRANKDWQHNDGEEIET